MTKEEFFGAVKLNLEQLVQEHAPLPKCKLQSGKLNTAHWVKGILHVRELREVTKSHHDAPRFARVWDLIGVRPFGGRPLKFRVFACFTEAADAAECARIKFELRKWYQVSGLASGGDRPYAGALVIGFADAPNAEAQPTGNDLPPEVQSEMWTWRNGNGIEKRSVGVETVGAVVSRAMTPEVFEKCKARVKRAADDELIIDCGNVTAQLIAEKTRVGEDVVINIFYDLVAGGGYVIKKKSAVSDTGKKHTLAEQIYIEKGTPKIWQRHFASKRGKWFKHEGIGPVVTASGAIGIVLLALEFGLKKLKLVDEFMPHISGSYLWIILGGLAAVALFVFVFKFFGGSKEGE